MLDKEQRCISSLVLIPLIPVTAGAAKPKAGGGLLGAFVRSLGVSVVGTAALT